MKLFTATLGAISLKIKAIKGGLLTITRFE